MEIDLTCFESLLAANQKEAAEAELVRVVETIMARPEPAKPDQLQAVTTYLEAMNGLQDNYQDLLLDAIDEATSAAPTPS